MRRIQVLSQQLSHQACIGEQQNLVVDKAVEGGSGRKSKHKTFRFGFVRETIKIVFADPSAADERYGGAGNMAIIEGELIKPKTESSTVVVFMHPSGIMNLLPMPTALARAGLHVCTCCSRYPNNDTCLIMEKVVMDLGACVRHLKQAMGYKTVLLAGWSGGGSLSSFYQAQAEAGAAALTHAPAGDLVNLPEADLTPADGLLIMAAHSSRARIFTEWLDPAPLDESIGAARDPELDLWDPRNPNKPPFAPEYVARFRAAQVARNRRITAWAKEQLAEIERSASGAEDWRAGQRDRGFMVQCTQADPRRVDTTLDPNGREVTSLLELAKENHSPVGLARFTTLRSWLSQWSLDASNADGPRSLARVKVPVLVLANEADHLVPLTHPQAMYDAIGHGDKELLVVKGATHYYFGQNELMASAVDHVIGYLRKKGFLEPEFVDAK